MENNNVVWLNGQRFFSEDYIIEKMVEHTIRLRPDMNTVKQTEIEGRTITSYEIFLRHYLADHRMREKFQRTYLAKRYGI